MMARLHSNAVSGILSAPLTNNGTTMSAAALANLIAVTGSDTALIVLDPEGAANGPEAVWVTAHTGAATTATISRAAETGGGLKATGQVHASGTKWVHPLSILDITGATPAASAAGDTAVTGASGRWADSAHRHAREAVGLVGDLTTTTPGNTAVAGTTGRPADAAHRHATPAFGAVGDISSTYFAKSAGSTGKFADAGHVHDIDIAVAGNGLTAILGALHVVTDDDTLTISADAVVVKPNAFNAVVKTHVKSASGGQTTVTATSSPGTTLPMKSTHTITQTRTGQVFVVDGLMNVEYTGGGGGGDLQAAVCELFVDGVLWSETEGGEAFTPQIIGYGHVAGILFRLNVTQKWVLSGLSNGTHTLALRAYKLGSGDTVKVDDGHSCLVSDRRG